MTKMVGDYGSFKERMGVLRSYIDQTEVRQNNFNIWNWRIRLLLYLRRMIYFIYNGK